jgi:hypothetical protein
MAYKSLGEIAILKFNGVLYGVTRSHVDCAVEMT